MKLIMFTKPYCTYCVKLKDLLEKEGVSFEVLDIIANENWLHFLLEEGLKSVPQVYEECSDGSCRRVGDYSDIAADITLVKPL